MIVPADRNAARHYALTALFIAATAGVIAAMWLSDPWKRLGDHVRATTDEPGRSMVLIWPPHYHREVDHFRPVPAAAPKSVALHQLRDLDTAWLLHPEGEPPPYASPIGSLRDQWAPADESVHAGGWVATRWRAKK